MFVDTIRRFVLRCAIASAASFAFVLAAGFGSPAHAQPGPGSQDLSQLQTQLQSLQAQIASMQQQPGGQASPVENSRVKSVGSQRMQRSFAPDVEQSLHIRLYDLSDIFAVSPHYPATMPDDLELNGSLFHNRHGAMIGGGGIGGGGIGGGMGGGGGGGVFRIEPTRDPFPRPIRKQDSNPINMRAAQVSMDQLVNTIKQTVEPEMWGSGRDEAKVEFLGNTLLITATNSMHTQINNLLNLFREHWGKLRTISIQTYWIRAGAAEAAELLSQQSNDEIGAGVVAPEKWRAFLDAAKTDARFAYSVALTGHNNQTLSALSGEQKQLTLDAIPFETTEASMWFEQPEDIDPFGDDARDDDDLNLFNRTRRIIGFKPVRQSFHNGAAIQVTPLATRGGNFVILDLHAKVNELMDTDGKRPSVFVQTEDGARSEVELDQANYLAYRLNTTLRCPKEQIVLAGGMTYGSAVDDEQPNLYLFVKVSVHTIKEDKSDWTPEESESAARPTAAKGSAALTTPN